MTTGIYKITNLVNNKVYIGASKNIEKRWSSHRNGRTAIAEDLQTFGLDNFKFEVLLECPEDMLAQWERDMICLYDSDDPEKGYNCKNDRPYSLKNSEVRRGKPSGMKGRSLSEETKRKISETLKGHTTWNKGIPHLEETKRKISEANKGHVVSEETRRKICEAHRGISHTEEERRKISETLKGHKAWNKGLKVSDETRRKKSEKMKEYWRKKKELNELKIHSNNELKIHSNNEKQNKQI